MIQRDGRVEPLTKYGKRYIVRDHMAAVIQVVLALSFAQTLRWKNVWLYGAVLLTAKLISALLLVRINPAVLNARGTRREMSKRERVFFSIFVPAGLSVPVIAGLEVGAPGWSSSIGALIAGLGLLSLGLFIIIWALSVNAFFEPTVRIQNDREQSVCTAGPYRIVRHPGYVGAIIAMASPPLILGSVWCWVPVAITTVAFIVRTRYEDRLLLDELQGYEAYAAATRYRLLPFVW